VAADEAGRALPGVEWRIRRWRGWARVVCWVCGNKARRVPSVRGLEWRATEGGRINVVRRRFRPLAYGRCGAAQRYEPVPCMEPMLRPRDAAMVLRAAVEWEDRGMNR